MSQVQRKQCADCGTPSLESDPSCWACGGRDFVPIGTKLAGERTLAISGSFDRTIAARMPRTLPPQLPLICAALSGALLIGLAGYWVGRVSSQPPPPESAAAGPTIRQPIALPPPPVYTNNYSQPPPPVYPGPRSHPSEPVQVSIRDVPSKPKPAQKPAATPPPGPVLPTALASAATAAPSSTASPFAAAPALTPRPTPPTTRRPNEEPAPRLEVQSRPTPTPDVVRPKPAPGGPPTPVPTSTLSVVNLRNDASIPVEVEVTLEGNRIRQALIAPESLIPIRLSPGSYQLRVLGKGSSSASSSLTLTANRTYALLINRRDEEGKSVLGFIEPLEPD